MNYAAPRYTEEEIATESLHRRAQQDLKRQTDGCRSVIGKRVKKSSSTIPAPSSSATCTFLTAGVGGDFGVDSGRMSGERVLEKSKGADGVSKVNCRS